MKLVPDKCHLVVMNPNKDQNEFSSCFLTLNGSHLFPSSHAEHLGLLRTNSLRNISIIQDKIFKHKKALFPVLSCGGAKGHSGNPAASILVEKLYASPVLLSGLASLVLNKGELNMVSQHQKLVLQNLLKLHSRTSHEAVYFLSGSLPATALIHIQMFGLLGMISRLGSKSILYSLAIYSIHHQVTPSWFWYVHELAILYQLPSVISILISAPPKLPYKRLVKEQVIKHWRTNLINSMRTKPSLHFLRPEFLPIGSDPHPLWMSCDGSNHSIRAATIHGRVISGRYRDDYIISKFNPELSGKCCLCGYYPGDFSHWLSFMCQPLANSLYAVLTQSLEELSPWPALQDIVQRAFYRDSKGWTSYVVDPSTDVMVIPVQQRHGPKYIWPLFKLSRSLIWCVHRKISEFRRAAPFL